MKIDGILAKIKRIHAKLGECFAKKCVHLIHICAYFETSLQTVCVYITQSLKTAFSLDRVRNAIHGTKQSQTDL